jgi:hypothetical protein
MSRNDDVSVAVGSDNVVSGASPDTVGAAASDGGAATVDASLTPTNAADVGPVPGTEGFTAGDNLVQALLQFGEGTAIDPTGPEAASPGGADADMADVAAAIDDLGGMLDMLGPRLDALIAEVNLFDIDVPGDSFGDA